MIGCDCRYPVETYGLSAVIGFVFLLDVGFDDAFRFFVLAHIFRFNLNMKC
jgi:hypothetical protein